MLYIVLAYLMLFSALTNSVCLNNASSFFFFIIFVFCQGYELSGEIALKNNHYKLLLLLLLWFAIRDILRVYMSSTAIAVKFLEVDGNTAHSNKACL